MLYVSGGTCHSARVTYTNILNSGESMALKRVIVVQYSTHYDDYEDYHEVTFHEIREAVRFTRDHAFSLRSTRIDKKIIGHEQGFKLTDL
jgi:hypothetical protein